MSALKGEVFLQTARRDLSSLQVGREKEEVQDF